MEALFDQEIKFYSLLVGAGLPAVSEKALDNVPALIGVVYNKLQILVFRIVVTQIFQKQTAIKKDAGKEIVDLMGNSGCELAK